MFDKYLTKTGLLSTKQPQEVKNQWYIKKFQEVHGDRYDYSSIIYVKSSAEVTITCKRHGEFRQTPNHHLSGQGCPTCADLLKEGMGHTACISQFTKVHGNVYDYSMVQYKNAYTKVRIICKDHGVFLQTPNAHSRGQGCPKCSVCNQDTLYVLRCNNTGLYKVGITNNLGKRISSIGGSTKHIAHIKCENPRQLEKCIHVRLREHRVFNASVSSGGTEFFQLSEPQVEELLCFLSQHQDQ